MMADIEAIAVQGGAELARASLSALTWIFAGLLGLGLAAVLAVAWGRLAAREPFTLVITGPCRWCDDPDCIDSALCCCAVPCPMPYCRAAHDGFDREVARLIESEDGNG